MANIENLLKSVLNVGKTVLPLLGPQVAGATAAISAIAKLIADAKAAGSGSGHAATLAELTTLQADVNAHADRVFAHLGGTPPPPGGSG
jgi:hypothetical protein